MVRFFDISSLFSENFTRINKLSKFIFFVYMILSKVTPVFATETDPLIDISFNGQNLFGQTDPTLQILFLITLIALVPTMLLMMTCFTRIIICFHFIRSAIGTQQMPPNQILIGLSLFLTFFIMGPVFSEINQTALQPYAQGEITTQQAMENGMLPIREFMFAQVENDDLTLFTTLDGGTYETMEDIPNRILIPAFMLGEITKGFIFGFIVYIPFLVIDMVVASVLMAMGMMMLPPSMISLPFKVMFFVLVDGWSLMIGNMVTSFR